MNLLVESEIKYDFIFEKDRSDGGGYGNRAISVGLAVKTNDGEITPANDELVQERLIHECVHPYTEAMGYDATIVFASGYSNFDVRRDYQEAAAITVEERFLLEMNYPKRDVATQGGIGTNANSYGCWPWDARIKYGQKIFENGYGVSLMQSRYIWMDIQRNYYGGKVK